MFIAKDAPLLYRCLQRLVWGLLKVIARLDVTGIENVPRSGPVLIAPNHLHSLDIPLVGLVIPRHPTVFAADKWRGKLGGKILELGTQVIYVARGEADREALGEALKVLKAGRTLAIAPEGTRSRTGGLQTGKHGAVYLASRSGAAIVPLAIWGQEKALDAWRHLRRPALHAHIGAPILLPPSAARARLSELETITDDLMLTLARMLPAEYRGVYADRVTDAG